MDLSGIGHSFFQEHAPDRADELWADWVAWIGSRKRSEGARLRWLLEQLAHKSPSAASHYVNGRRERLGADALGELDEVARLLGRADLCSRGPRLPQPGESARIVLFSELDVPSRAFHARIIGGLLREASHHRAVVSIHETDPARLDGSVGDVVQAQLPHAAIFLRLTPTPLVLERLYARGIPAVVLHGDRLSYPAPVITSIVPSHASIEKSFEPWLRALPEEVERPLLVTLEDDVVTPVPASWLLPDTPRSLRRDRIESIRAPLERICGLTPADHLRVADFSHLRAFEIYAAFPDRDLYVVLSDDVALVLRELLAQVAAEPAPRVVGYDFTPEARSVLPSFDQGLDTLASHAIKALSDLWVPGVYPTWGERCQEVTRDVVLRTVPGL
jgi:DNA-binding LacI/PurR family transcriptional regulator